MHEQRRFQTHIVRRWLALLIVLVLAWSVSCASSPNALPAPPSDVGTSTDVSTDEATAAPADDAAAAGAAAEMLAVIIQGEPGVDLVALVAQFGGEVTRDLSVISSVAANVPADQLAALEQAEGVRRVWQDNDVESSDSLRSTMVGRTRSP